MSRLREILTKEYIIDDFLKRELNPLRDFEWFRYEQNVGQTHLDELGHYTKNSALNMFNYTIRMPKHILRGAAYGGAIGALVYLVMGENPAIGLQKGIAIGSLLDSVQFCLRSLIQPRTKISRNILQTEN